MTNIPGLLLKDLNTCYDNLQQGYTQGDHGRTMMGLLFHAKLNQWVDEDFLNYWFIKIINAPVPMSLFYLEKDNYELFGFSPEKLSNFLGNHCSFLLKRGYLQLAQDIMQIALDNDCFFQNSLIEKLQTQGNLDVSSYIEKNNYNFSLHLEKFNLKKDSDVKRVKV